MRFLALLLLVPTLAWADGEQAGEFDYYILSLTWSPNWCALEGDARGADQCDERHDHGWIVHGLWPQYEAGWPSFCRTSERDPSRSDTRAMTDIMGSSGLAWHQWKKHGRCSGLSADEYFETARRAYEGLVRPEVFRNLDEPVRISASVVEAAFLRANPDWTPDMVTITCKSGHIQEARLCLTRDLQPRICGADVVHDCSSQSARFNPIR